MARNPKPTYNQLMVLAQAARDIPVTLYDHTMRAYVGGRRTHGLDATVIACLNAGWLERSSGGASLGITPSGMAWVLTAQQNLQSIPIAAELAQPTYGQLLILVELDAGGVFVCDQRWTPDQQWTINGEPLDDNVCLDIVHKGWVIGRVVSTEARHVFGLTAEGRDWVDRVWARGKPRE